MTTAPHLRLVSTFSDGAYPYCLFKNLDNPYNSTERSLAIERFREAVHIAGISDYKIFETGGQIHLNLRTNRDFLKATVAAQPGNMALMAAQYDPQISHRIIKKRCKMAFERVNEIVPGKIDFMHDTADRMVAMNGADKKSYFLAEKLNPLMFIVAGTRL